VKRAPKAKPAKAPAQPKKVARVAATRSATVRAPASLIAHLQETVSGLVAQGVARARVGTHALRDSGKEDEAKTARHEVTMATKKGGKNVASSSAAGGWACPQCKRRFTRPNQRHACGTGDRASVLRDRPPELVALYGVLETFVQSLGTVEFVTRERYVLLRTSRIFTDLVVMSGALRVAIHLRREAKHALFIKVVSDRGKVTHVALLRSPRDLEAIKPFLREAYESSIESSP
jgi:predicted transport protein